MKKLIFLLLFLPLIANAQTVPQFWRLLQNKFLVPINNGWVIGSSTSAFQFRNATGTNLNVTNLTVTNCTGCGGGSAFTTTTLTIQGTTLSSTAYTLATSSDTNIGLTIQGSGSTVTFTPVWLGTLADNRITSAANWNSKLNVASSGQSLTLGTLSGSTYSTVQHLMNLSMSTGLVSGGAITGSGTNASVAAGTGVIKATDSDVAAINFFDWAASSSIAIPASSTRYLGITYNSGSPYVVMKTTDSWDIDTEFPLGTVVREGSTLFISNNPWQTGDPIGNIIERFDGTKNISRDERTGGLILSNTGTRNVAVTAGTLFARLSEFSISAIDTSAAGTAGFNSYYRDGSGGWTREATTTQWENTKYDDGDGTLGTMTALTFASRWFYLMTDGTLAMLYGQSDVSSLSLTINESPPASVPDRILKEGILIGRFIIQASGSTPSQTQSAFGTAFTAASVSAHSDLSGLAWTSSGHTGTASTLAGFDPSGVAISIATSAINLVGINFTNAAGTNLTLTGVGSSTNWQAGGLQFGNATGTNLLLNGVGSSTQWQASGLQFNNATGTNIFISGVASSTRFQTGGLSFNNATGTTLVITGVASSTSFQAGGLSFNNATGTNAFFSGVASSTAFQVSNLQFGIATGTSLNITSKLGIGTSTPLAFLTVSSTVSTASPFNIQPMSCPASPNNGDICIDTVTNNLLKYINGVWLYGSDTIFSQTVTVTKFANNSLNNYLSTGKGTTSTPAGFFTVGKKLRLTVTGNYTSPASATSTLGVQIQLGTSTIAFATTSIPAAAGAFNFALYSTMTTRSTGPAGTMQAWGDVDFNDTSSSIAKSWSLLPASTTATFNSQIANVLKLNMVMSVSSTVYTINVTDVGVEVIN